MNKKLPRLLTVENTRIRNCVGDCVWSFSVAILMSFYVDTKLLSKEEFTLTLQRQNSRNEAKAKNFAGKMMATIFWDALGIMQIDIMRRYETVGAKN